MDALRKQLDVLMGANRNGDAQEVTRKYNDRDVCRLYLAGLCPHELFQLTVSLQRSCVRPHIGHSTHLVSSFFYFSFFYFSHFTSGEACSELVFYSYKLI